MDWPKPGKNIRKDESNFDLYDSLISNNSILKNINNALIGKNQEQINTLMTEYPMF